MIFLSSPSAIGYTFAVLLFLRGGDARDGTTVRVVDDGCVVAYGSAGIALAGATGSVAIAAIRREFWPSWYGWLSALAAVIGLISVGGILWTSSTGLLLGFAAFIGFRVWTLATSVLMYRDS